MLEPGSTFDRYAIEALLGQGGWGQVFRAVDTRLRRKVALKVLLPERAADGARLLREARAAAAFQHPNVVSIFDMGEANGTPYIAMELVEGEPLSQVAGPGANIPTWQKIAWLADIARALAAAHQAGVLHRDVKPQNVMVTRAGAIKVLDFGLAKPVQGAGSSNSPLSAAPKTEWQFQTRVGFVVGTPRYMAPEALAGEECDGRADQYSWGVVAFELLAGAHPRAGDAGQSGGQPAVPPLLSQLVRDVPFAFAVLVAKAVAYQKADRFADMGALVAQIDSSMQTAPVAASPSRAGTVPDMDPGHPATDPRGAMTQAVRRVAALPTTVDQPAMTAKPPLPQGSLDQTATAMDAVPWHRAGAGGTLQSLGQQPPEPRSIHGAPAVVSTRPGENAQQATGAPAAFQGTVVSPVYIPGAPPQAAPPHGTMQSPMRAPAMGAEGQAHAPSPLSGSPQEPPRAAGPHGTATSPAYAQGAPFAQGAPALEPYPVSGPTQVSAGIGQPAGLAPGTRAAGGNKPGFELRRIHMIGIALGVVLVAALLVVAYSLGAAGRGRGASDPGATGGPLTPGAPSPTGAAGAQGDHGLPVACDQYLSRLSSCGPAGAKTAKALHEAWMRAGIVIGSSCVTMDRALDHNPICPWAAMPGPREPGRDFGPRPNGHEKEW